ncbi:MAG: Eco57I restriction-modification methylase domain-containing protein [Planctomycetota bacterium]
MNEAGRILQDITASNFRLRPQQDRVRIFNDFSQHFGWRPSDYLEPVYGLGEKSNGHLIVEHGLEHAAVITFMAAPVRGTDLAAHEVRMLLAISYNNLVDLHRTVDDQCVCTYTNRLDPPTPERLLIEPPGFGALSAERFQAAMESTRVGNLPALDTVLIETIDYWKRFLHDEITCKKKNEAISALFNAIIFVRFVEDHYKLTHANSSLSLLERWRRDAGRKNLPDVLLAALRAYQAGRGAASLLSTDRLEAFKKLDASMIESLIGDFYKVRRVPYEYNFALMSRHALSRIYEKYVALLRQEKIPDGKERTLFPIDLPEAERNKAAGAIYTPQFIPRFFCRFIEDQLPPPAFRDLRIADPACGSGIFLLIFLERKTRHLDLTTSDIRDVFAGIMGLDIDENACQVSRLSLARLHLMRTNTLPRSTKVQTDDAIGFYQSHNNLAEGFGAVVGNPPFVRFESQTPAMKRRVKSFLSDIQSEKADLYLGILRVAMKMVKPNGFLGFVLPHSFLVNEGPESLRKELKEQFWLRCVVDLSAIRVFEDFSAYIILLVAQKKPESTGAAPACRVVLCQDFVGRALQDCLDNRTVRTPYYSVFDVDQGYFGEGAWVLLGTEEAMLERRLQAMPKVSSFLNVREGLITGCDEVFIMPADRVPADEKRLYVPFLADREIERYAVPKITQKFVYYPYHNMKRISETELRKAKSTWSYLVRHRKRLPKTAAKTWPYLVRARQKDLLQPKIVSPHLVLSPRFALDLTGQYAVSRGPFLVPREKEVDLELLKFFTAALNSSIVHWYLGTHAYRFSRGYVKLDPRYLSEVPVPDPSRVKPSEFRRIVSLVDERIETGSLDLDGKIDKLVLDTYGLTSAERELLGVREI